MKPKQAFAVFRQWYAHANLSGYVAMQAHQCLLHVNCLEINLPSPDKKLLAGALSNLCELERMLAFPTI